MSDYDKRQIAELSERLLATREQREDWAKFATEMQRERDAARQEIRTLTAALDAAQAQARQQSIDTTLPLYQDFLAIRADRDRLAACVERVRGCERIYAPPLRGTWVRATDILDALGEP
jgi:hypothetical protein